MTWSAAQRYAAEFLGTFALLLAVGAAAVFSLPASDPNARAILVSASVGLILLGMVYVFGEISGGHFNPAVTISMALSRKMPPRDVVPYIVMQVLGGITGTAIVLAIAYGSSTQYLVAQSTALASQCYAGMGAPPGCAYSLGAVFLIELALTFLLVLVIQFVTRPESSTKNLAPVAIGFTLLVTNLMAIRVDGASINPVRSFSPAVVSLLWTSARWSITESWIFWLAPILGGILAAVVDRALGRPRNP
jgi:aquaporin Z